MRTKLFFFSGTGNSLMLTRELAARLKDVEIINIKNLIGQQTVCKDERIGIIFPVYAMGLPLIVRNFLENIKPEGNSYFFAISNAASGYGIALEQVNEFLKKKNLQLNAAFNIFMPSNYLPFGGAESEKKQKKKFAAASVKLDEIAPFVAEQLENSIPHQWYMPRWFCRLIYRIFISHIHQSAKKFHHNSQCTGCGICAKVCPVNNISITDNHPQWGNKCEQCFACLQFCPTEAIQVGRISPKRQHYHHPAVKAEDLF